MEVGTQEDREEETLVPAQDKLVPEPVVRSAVVYVEQQDTTGRQASTLAEEQTQASQLVRTQDRSAQATPLLWAVDIPVLFSKDTTFRQAATLALPWERAQGPEEQQVTTARQAGTLPLPRERTQETQVSCVFATVLQERETK